MLLDLESVFRTQLRAILRANTPGNLRIMLPMITTLEELDASRELLCSVCEELDVKPPPLGVMIETPAAVALARHIAERVDFLSIGTNDLVQYTLAVDRGNERVAAAYDPFHPAVVGQLRSVSEAAHAVGVSLSICGELAGNPIATPLLLGLGIHELSMTPFWVMAVRQVVRATCRADAERLACAAESCGRGSEVRAHISRFFAETGLLADSDFGPGLQRLLEPRLV
jgi:phosphotransferase system enzyme I (PtsI)